MPPSAPKPARSVRTAQVADSNQTLNAFLGGSRPSWMTSAPPAAGTNGSQQSVARDNKPKPRGRPRKRKLSDTDGAATASPAQPQQTDHNANHTRDNAESVLSSQAPTHDSGPTTATQAGIASSGPQEPATLNLTWMPPSSCSVAATSVPNTVPHLTPPAPAPAQLSLTTLLATAASNADSITQQASETHGPLPASRIQKSSTASSSNDTRPNGNLDCHPVPAQKRPRTETSSQDRPSPRLQESLLLPTWTNRLKSHLDQCGGPGTLNATIERPRYRMIQEACNSSDTFYLLLHQNFCLWSRNKRAAYGVMSGGVLDEKTMDSAYEMMLHILKDNLNMAPAHLEWLSLFPMGVPGNKSIFDGCADKINQVATFLAKLSSLWRTILHQVETRQYPIMVWEMKELLCCRSVVLQPVLFTVTRRRLGIVEGPRATQLNLIYQEDALGESRLDPNNASTTSLNSRQQTRNAIIARYRSIMNGSRPLTSPYASPNIQHPQAHLASLNGSSAASSPRSHHGQLMTQGSATSRVNTASPRPGHPNWPRPVNNPSQIAPSAPAATRRHSGHHPSRPFAGYGASAQPEMQGRLPSNGPTPLPNNVPLPQGQHMMRGTQLPSQAANPSFRSQPYQYHSRPLMRPLGLPSQLIIPTTPGLNGTRTPILHQWPGHGATGSPAGPLSPHLQVLPPNGQQQHTRATLPSTISTHRPRSVVLPSQRDIGASSHVPGQQGNNDSTSTTRPLPAQSSAPSGFNLINQRSPRRVPVSHRGSRFYQFIGSASVNPTRLRPQAGVQRFEFSLSDEVISKVSRTDFSCSPPVCRYRDGSIRFRLRFCLHDGRGQQMSLDQWVALPTCWPEHVHISLNNTATFPRRRQHYHQDLPIELTDMIISGKNLLQISLPDVISNRQRNSAFYVAVEVIHTCSHETIKATFLDKPPIPPTATKKEIQKRLRPSDSDDVVADNNWLSVTVADPFSASLFKIPVRGEKCKHLECFDLDTWLGTRPKKQHRKSTDEPCMVDVWKCPICDGDARPGSLSVDDFFVGVRRRLVEDGQECAKCIRIKVDGTWEAVISDDEGDEESNPHIRRQASRSTPGERPVPETIEIIDDD